MGRLRIKMLALWWRMSVPYRLRSMGVTVANGAVFYGMPIVSLWPGSKIHICERAVLCSDSRFTALGVNHPVVLRTLGPGAEISIGSDTGISGGTVCAATSVRIGKECMFGANVTIADTDFHAIAPENRRFNKNGADIASTPVVIGDNVFLGTGVIVLKGVAVGDNSVVGSGSLVVKSIPGNCIAAGNPARMIREIAAPRPSGSGA